MELNAEIDVGLCREYGREGRYGRGDGADTSGDTTKLMLGEVSVPLDKVLSVKETKTEQSNP